MRTFLSGLCHARIPQWTALLLLAFVLNRHAYGDEPANSTVAADAFTVKGVAVVQGHKMAIINNHTFAVGDEGDVLTTSGRVHLRLLDIQTSSVVIEANGTKLEIAIPTGNTLSTQASATATPSHDADNKAIKSENDSGSTNRPVLMEGPIIQNHLKIGSFRIYGEGTTVISFDNNQNAILWDANGKPIAGYEAEALNPAAAKITQRYEYWWKHDGKETGIYLRQEVEKVVLENGKLTISGADTNVITGYRVKGQNITINFKSFTQANDPSNHNCNLILTPDGSKTFRFDLKPTRALVHRITDNGEFGAFLEAHGENEKN